MTAAQTVCEVLNCTPSDPFTLTTLTAAEIIAAMLSEKSHTAAVNDAFDLVINNLSTTSDDITLTAAADGSVTILGSTVISASSNADGTARFRFICTNTNTPAFTIVRV